MKKTKLKVVNSFIDKDRITRCENEILYVEENRVDNLVKKGYVEVIKEDTYDENIEIIEEIQNNNDEEIANESTQNKKKVNKKISKK